MKSVSVLFRVFSVFRVILLQFDFPFLAPCLTFFCSSRCNSVCNASYLSFHRINEYERYIIYRSTTVGENSVCVFGSASYTNGAFIAICCRATCTSVNERLNAFNVFEAKIKISDEPNWSHTYTHTHIHMQSHER